MSYGMFEMQMEDEQQHEDGMAIAAGTMCRFCLSVMHVASSYETCPRNEIHTPCAGCQETGHLLTRDSGGVRYCSRCTEQRALDRDAYEADQANKPDFTCSNCKRDFFTPHEGYFLDPHDEMVGRCVDCHIKNFKPCNDERCCA